MKTIICLSILLILLPIPASAQAKDPAAFRELFNGKDLSGWVDVNTSTDTWTVSDGLLVCSGLPIGVMRSEKQYENFMLHIEWRHMKAGGNSGVFVWSEGTVPAERNLPKGMEVQMLELEWPYSESRKGRQAATDRLCLRRVVWSERLEGYARQSSRASAASRSKCAARAKGEWNIYDVVCVDGTVKLSINGKFVNGVRQSSVRKGYLCLESEGSEIHFRNIRILELPPGNAPPE